ncbi:glucose-6-phosphate isomerase [Candidatus Uhrbacteria bacterium]|nr:glucose-6-phosphate isomerase [Candidatus Uhrbacteria bacterium]
MASALSYDATFALLPRHESAEAFLRSQAGKLSHAHSALRLQRQSHAQGWFDLPFDHEMIKRVRSLVHATKAFETLLVLGIGGSDLGARAILQALPFKRQVLFAGSNTDPDELASILSSMDLKKTLVNIVSKSGDTIEPMSAFLVIRERLKKLVGKDFTRHIVATTDLERGTLIEWARREGYHRLIIPSNVGGRFSVLSDVGLFPAAWAGIDIEALVDGAAGQMKSFEKDHPAHQLPAIYAAIHADAYLKHGRSLFVFMPYHSALFTFALWYRQLIAESLGKAKNRSGLAVSMGPTPIAGIGAADQHSQIQLYIEGPADKLFTFLEIEKFNAHIKLPAAPYFASAFDGIGGRSMQDLIHAERRATAEALASRHRPSGTLFLSKLDARGLGELFQFFMLATAYLGELFDVNAYDQPGVQEGKRRFAEWIRGE